MANNNVTLVQNASLNLIAADIKTRSGVILETFNDECTAAIKSTDEALKVAGLSSDMVLGAFKKIFENMDERIKSLSEFVTKTVNDEYSYTSKYITDSFDNNVSAKLDSLLNETNIAAATASNNVDKK